MEGERRGQGSPIVLGGLATCLKLSAVAPMGLPPTVQVHFPHATNISLPLLLELPSAPCYHIPGALHCPCGPL